MTSSLHQWESDPLLSAAEVVQDSADRMESIYRLLLHEQSVVQGDHPDQRFLSSLDYHRRDLATILETTKWQLEDFERAVSSSAMMDKSRSMKNVISRHKQFIGAIREQINQVEKSIENPSMDKFVRNSEWVNLNKRERDGLASFLSGGNLTDHVIDSDREDTSIIKRFLDPTTASSSKDAVIIEHECQENENMDTHGIQVGHYYGLVKENNLRVDSSYPTISGIDVLDSLQETSCSRHNEDGSWDLEADEVKPKSFFHDNKWRGHNIRIFGYLNNLWTAYGRRFNGNYTKRFKDGEEGRNSPSFVDVSDAVRGQHIGFASRDNCLQSCSGLLAKPMQFCIRLGACEEIYQRFPCLHTNRYLIRLILAALIILSVLVVLVCRVA